MNCLYHRVLIKCTREKSFWENRFPPFQTFLLPCSDMCLFSTFSLVYTEFHAPWIYRCMYIMGFHGFLKHSVEQTCSFQRLVSEITNRKQLTVNKGYTNTCTGNWNTMYMLHQVQPILQPLRVDKDYTYTANNDIYMLYGVWPILLPLCWRFVEEAQTHCR